MAAATAGLGKADDWEARMKALGLLQGLALGDGMEVDGFPMAIRGMHDLLAAQIADLRSTLCKEACRTAAVLSRRMGQAFASTAELLIPALMKQACVKTQIMATAADRHVAHLPPPSPPPGPVFLPCSTHRCLRSIVSATTHGYPKILPIFFDAVANKNSMATTRRIAMEYICLASAIWPR